MKLKAGYFTGLIFYYEYGGIVCIKNDTKYQITFSKVSNNCLKIKSNKQQIILPT